MDSEGLINSLEAARQEPWFVLAGIVSDGSGGAALEQRKAVAIKSSGLSANMMTRYVSVLARIRDISGKHGIPIDRLLTPVFSATEIAVRIYDKDPASGLSALEKLKERRTTLVKLRDELAEIEKRRQLDKAGKGKSIEECEVALREFVKSELGPKVTLVRRPALKPFSKVGWLVLAPRGQPVWGIDLFDADGQVWEAQLMRAIPLSSFFESFFMLFHGELEEEAFFSAKAVLDFFRAPSFGTLHLKADGSLQRGRDAGYLVGNRRSDYSALEKMFAYGRGPRLGEHS
jgi:hypothetical protein